MLESIYREIECGLVFGISYLFYAIITKIRPLNQNQTIYILTLNNSGNKYKFIQIRIV